MKITLIYLPHLYLSNPDSQSPLGLMYLASILRNNDVDVELKNYTSVPISDAIDDLDESDVYGITVTSMELLQANRFAKLIKAKFPKSLIILGGPGAYSDEFVDWSVIDSICKGEAEKTILDMMKDLGSRKFSKIYYGDPVIDLDSIPLPARDLLGKHQGGDIFAYNKRYKKGQTTVLLTSRGCAFNCAFCSAPRNRECGKVIRYRSPQNIRQEIDSVIKNFDIRQFRISDDMFTQNENHVRGFCEMIKPFDVAWRISCRVKPFTEEMAYMLKDAGCKEVSFGIESFDDNVLKVLKKGTTKEDNINALRVCRKVGLKTRALMMIGTPGQTRDTIKINMETLEVVPHDIVACTVFMPIPGSEIWNHPERFGVKILNTNLDDYNFYFFGSAGENEIKDIIEIEGRDQDEFREEIVIFRDYLKSTHKINKG